MAITLPALEDSFCQAIGVCSHIRENEPIGQLPSDDLEIIASYRPSSGRMLTHLVWNPGSRHLHVDVAHPSAFGEDPPETNERISTFRKILARFEGMRATASPHGSFMIPLTSLPPAGGLIFIRKNRLNTGAEIELTSATLTFRRAKIRRMRWSLLVDDKVWLDVAAARVELAVDENYLTNALETCNSAVASYVLRKKTDG